MISRFSAHMRAGFASDYQFGAATVLFATIAWSSTGLFTRIIPHDAFTQLFWRGIFGGLTALVFVVLQNGPRTLSLFRAFNRTSWAFCLFNTAGMITFITAMNITTIAHVTIIYATMPLVAAISAWFFLRERPSVSSVIASLIAAAGVGLTVVAGLGEGAILGDILAILMTGTMVGALIVQRSGPVVDPVAAAAVSSFLCSLCVAPWATPLSVNAQDLGLLALFGATNTGFGLILFFVGARHIPATLSGLIGALDAPLSPFWVWLILGETPRPTTILGGVIVIVAVTGHMLWSMRDPPQDPARP